MRHLQTWGIHGLGRLAERKVIGWFYRRQTSQYWSPMMHEITTEYGVRFGGLRVGWSWTEKHFRDGREPRVIAGPY